jgi:putative aldouronate transport system permease protein
VFLAVITTINSNLYEAAEIDGAGHWQKCWHITLPGIKPMIVLMCILNIGNIMNAGFEQILVMYNPSVYDTGEILDTMGYTIGLLDGNFSVGTAIGLFQAVISCVCFIIAYRIAFKVSDYKLF